MPVTEDVSFDAVLGRLNRMRIPTAYRWKYKLEPREVLCVRLFDMFKDYEFYRTDAFLVRMNKQGQITIPKVIADKLELEYGQTVHVELLAKPPSLETVRRDKWGFWILQRRIRR